MKPTTQHELALYYLIEWDNFSLKDVINDSMFYKFQTRLAELEAKYGMLARRNRRMFISRFGMKRAYNEYQAIDKKQLINLFNKLQKNDNKR